MEIRTHADSADFPPAPMDGTEKTLVGRQKRSPGGLELASGLALVLSWGLLFAGGLFVPTEQHRNRLVDPGPAAASSWFEFAAPAAVPPLAGWAWFKSFAIVLFCYTMTNIFFLTIVTACLGCMTRRWRVTGSDDPLLVFYATLHPKRIYLAAALRGFLPYLLIVSGLLVISTDKSVIQTTFDQYLRIAGLASLAGFMVGFDPQVADRLMGRFNGLGNLPASADSGLRSKKA